MARLGCQAMFFETPYVSPCKDSRSVDDFCHFHFIRMAARILAEIAWPLSQHALVVLQHLASRQEKCATGFRRSVDDNL
jgi:hypothetical protein